MRIISENTKYPEFKESYKGQWISGHLVKVEDMYYHHAKRVVTEYSFDELPINLSELVSKFEDENSDAEFRAEEIRRNVAASCALKNWAKKNAHKVVRSNISESEYYTVNHNDKTYTIRVSGHMYPTGSMTDLSFNKIDSTDTCCARYCDMLGIQY